MINLHCEGQFKWKNSVDLSEIRTPIFGFPDRQQYQLSYLVNFELYDRGIPFTCARYSRKTITLILEGKQGRRENFHVPEQDRFGPPSHTCART